MPAMSGMLQSMTAVTTRAHRAIRPVGAAGRVREQDIRGERPFPDMPRREEKAGTGTGVPASTKAPLSTAGQGFIPVGADGE
jgi:hypothetical protein